MNGSDRNRGFGDSTDEELVLVAQAEAETPRGRAAATELLQRYRRAVYSWSYRYVRDHERALDLSQDVLIRAWQGLGSFGGRSRFSSWLFVITRNQCLKEVGRVNILADEGTGTELVKDHNPDPARRLEEREGEDRLHELIRTTLDPLEQRAIWLRCFERLPVDEITGLLGINDDSGARGVLQRARRKLRAALGES
jgi:RNA polymerase sigma-70 factor (ECF subfamily)